MKPHCYASELPCDKPADMGADEWGMRKSLYAAWRAGADQFCGMLLVAADYFEERGHPDAAVCRATWGSVDHFGPDPAGWWRWCVVPNPRYSPEPDLQKIGQQVRRGYTGRNTPSVVAEIPPNHNRKVWLCWPPTWVRCTGGFYFRHAGHADEVVSGQTPFDRGWVEFTRGTGKSVWKHRANPDAWCLCVRPRELRNSHSVEEDHPLGFSSFFSFEAQSNYMVLSLMFGPYHRGEVIPADVVRKASSDGMVDSHVEAGHVKATSLPVKFRSSSYR